MAKYVYRQANQSQSTRTFQRPQPHINTLSIARKCCILTAKILKFSFASITIEMKKKLHDLAHADVDVGVAIKLVECVGAKFYPRH